MRQKSDWTNRRFICSSGNALHKQYSPRIEVDGQVTLIESGVIDTDSVIQSYAEACDMAQIIRSIQTGEIPSEPESALYADVSELPRSPIGMLNFIADRRREFDALSAEQKETFGNDFNRFFAGIPVPVDDSAPDVNVESAPAEKEV
nr:virion structural protein [Microvirus sp.]